MREVSESFSLSPQAQSVLVCCPAETWSIKSITMIYNRNHSSYTRTGKKQMSIFALSMCTVQFLRGFLPCTCVIEFIQSQPLGPQPYPLPQPILVQKRVEQKSKWCRSHCQHNVPTGKAAYFILGSVFRNTALGRYLHKKERNNGVGHFPFGNSFLCKQEDLSSIPSAHGKAGRGIVCLKS